jgi:hypothetical protein
MPRKMARSAPSTTVRAARGAGNRLRLASVLREGRKSANIHTRSGVIRGIPDYTRWWMWRRRPTMPKSRSKLAALSIAVALSAGCAVLASSDALAIEIACVPGHHTVAPPCTFDAGVLSLDSATGPNGTELSGSGSGGGHNTQVTFPIDPVLGPGIEIAANVPSNPPPSDG